MPKFSAYDGTELAYHLKGEGPPLICLPGGPLRASAYFDELGGLTAHRQLVLLDLRGSGDSEAPADPSTYRRDRLVDDIEALREHLGLERTDLLAHSAAGDLALLYAARHPGRLSSLALVTPVAQAAGIVITDQERREAAELRSGEPWYPAARAALDKLLDGGFSAELMAAIRPFAYGRWDAAAQALAARSAAERAGEEARTRYWADGAFDAQAITAALAASEVPVLVLAGELDSEPGPARARELAALFPHGEAVVMRGAAHFPWLDDPGAFVRTVTAFLDPEVRTLDAAGVRIAHRTWGEPAAPPVVLLHCLGADGADWREVAGQLAAAYRVHAFDLRGHGLSDWPGDYGLEAVRDDVLDCLDALGLDRITLIGHSLGGSVAQLIASHRPGLVARLVLEDPPPLLPADPPMVRSAQPDDATGFDWEFKLQSVGYRNAPDPAWWDDLGRITAPTLIVAGGADSHLPQDLLAEMADRIPDGRLVTIDAGHLVHQARPADFLSELKAFGI
ncbi:alpha/beta hydrolase [Streptomyces sp. NPDC050738]|uniref:alpha/beta fold hydrolase n=1 Tax=Streptomyces sp. NPDC050738 TaxID=3154744 RepID=UPI00341A5424